jgi:ATP-dependent DNA helicase DinG
LAAARDEPEGGVMIHNHPSGVLEPSDADLGVAAGLWEQGLGTAITDNAATSLYVVVEPPEPRIRIALDAEALEAVVAPDGALAGQHRDYEDRPGQRDMIRRVAETYNEGRVLLVEAGTGTGKSLAYLLPAARWALDNDERTVVSTATINLQAQLAAKDLPMVARLLDEEHDTRAEDGGDAPAASGLTWALVKGRGNYIRPHFGNGSTRPTTGRCRTFRFFRRTTYGRKCAATRTSACGPGVPIFNAASISFLGAAPPRPGFSW